MTYPKMEDAMKSPIALLEGLTNDLERLNPGVQGLDRDLLTIKKRFENEGYGFLTVALPALDDALLQGLASGKFACPVGFKPINGGTIPRFLSGMFCEVFEPFSGLLKDAPDMGVVKGLRNVLRLFKKMRLEPSSEALLHKKAVDEFYQCDDVAGLVVIPDRHDHLIGRVSKLILNTLNSKDVSNATYKHGPGSVEEGYRANQKWLALSNELRSGSFDAPNFGLDVQTHDHVVYQSCSDNPEGSGDDKRRNGRILPARRNGRENGTRYTRPRGLPFLRRVSNGPTGSLLALFRRASTRNARLVTVLKNSTSRRTITIEPMVNQFVQQGLNILLREAISECRILRNCLALSDQTKNQVLALEGSLLDNWATIDLKSASDLLSLRLVESVFRHHGLFLDHMIDCRSPQVYSDLTEAKPLKKFAGMGNALTFPVQSICFAVVCIASILDEQGTTPTYWSVRRASRHIRVYGDDIIISRRYAHQCVKWLSDVGLKVNAKKSFLAGNFKESCGVEAYRGVDITPLYIKHRPDDTSTDPSIIAGLVSLSNHSWMEGLYEFSTCLKNEVEERLGIALPLVSRESGLLGWHSRIDTTVAHKWCKRTHQLLVRAPVLTPQKRDDRISGYAALLKYFCTSLLGRPGGESSLANWTDFIFPSRGEDKDHLDKTPMRFKSRIKSSWVPARVLLAG